MSHFPFPRIEIPKMIEFCQTNIDSSSIIDGEYLLESSLHPAPISLRLDFRYKEKKKSNKGNDGRGNDENSKTIDFTIFCFTVYYYSAKKLHKLSRKYRYVDRRILSRSLVREICTSIYNEYLVRQMKNTRKQRPSDTAYLLLRHSLTHAPISMLFCHLKDLNLTQLIHLFSAKDLTHLIHLQENDNNKRIDSNNESNSNSNGNSSIILSLHYLIIERVFQNDGECIVIRFSTLTDRKERKKLSSKDNNSIDDNASVPILQVLLNCINKKENDNAVNVSVLKLLLNLSKEVCCDNKNDIEEDNDIDANNENVSAVLLSSSKLLNHNNNDNARSNENRIDEAEHEEENETQSTIFVSLIDRKCELILLSKRSKRYIRIEQECILIIVLKLSRCISKEHIELLNRNNGDDAHLLSHLSKGTIDNYEVTALLLSRTRYDDDNQEERNIISVSLIDGECNDNDVGGFVLMIPLSVQMRTDRNENHNSSGVLTIISKLSSHKCTVCYEDDCNNYNNTSIIDTSVLILSSKLLKCSNNDDDNNDVNVPIMQVLLKCINEKGRLSNGNVYLTGGTQRPSTYGQYVSIRSSKLIKERHGEDKRNVIYVSLMNEECILIVMLSNHYRKLRNENNARVLSLRLLLNCPDDNIKKKIIDISVSLIDGECVLIILLSKQSKHPARYKEERLIGNDNNNDETCETCIYIVILLSRRIDIDGDMNIRIRQDENSIDYNNNVSIIRVPTIATRSAIAASLSKRVRHNENSIDCNVRKEDDCNNCKILIPYSNCFLRHDTSTINTSVFILLSKLMNHNKNDNEDDDNDYTDIPTNTVSNNEDDDNDHTDIPTNIVSKCNNNCILIIVTTKRADSEYNNHNKNVIHVLLTRLFADFVLILLSRLPNRINRGNNDNIVNNNMIFLSRCIDIDGNDEETYSRDSNIMDCHDENNMRYNDNNDNNRTVSKKGKDNNSIDTNSNNTSVPPMPVLSHHITNDDKDNISHNNNNIHSCTVHNTSIVNETKGSSKTGESSLINNNDRNDNRKRNDCILFLSTEYIKCVDDDSIDKKNDYDNKKHIITTTTLTTYSDNYVCHDIDINNKKKATLGGNSNDDRSDRNENNISTIESIVSKLLNYSICNDNNSTVTIIIDNGTFIFPSPSRLMCNNNNTNTNNKYDYENETITATMLTTTNCNDDNMNIIKDNKKQHINNTMITSSDNNSIDTSQLRLFMGSVYTQLFCLVCVMRHDIVLATCTQEYAYDIILKALFVFNCSILY